MDIAIIVLLSVLLTAVILLLKRLHAGGSGKDQIESVINSRFIDFSDRIREAMDNTRKEVGESNKVLSDNARRTLEHINEMNKTVRNLVEQQEKAEKLGQSLEYLLQTPKLRGNYGETVLEEMLEKILPRKSMWERQYTIEGGEKVDAVVKYRDVVIPIDSKFPKDDYQRYISAGNEEDRKKCWAAYEKALKVQINSIKEKYIKPEKGTTEFALLFIPSESIYYETIAEKNHLGDPCQIYEYAAGKKVIPVSPNTFYAFLQVIILGIRNIEIVKDAKKLQESLSRLGKDFELFYKRFENIGNSIEKASEAYKVGEGHVSRFKRNLDSTLSLDKRFQGEIESGLAGEDGDTG
ncbi:MAG: DNA recombination protein RmuC [Candidatus Omnitrophota bacterium]|nr:DNA recombination protein RmuC [Candidatus Omnitrophota bacterium]